MLAIGDREPLLTKLATTIDERKVLRVVLTASSH